MPLVYVTLIPFIYVTIYRQDCPVVLGFRHQTLLWRGFESHFCHFVDIPIKTIAACILHPCSKYLLPRCMPFRLQYTGRMAEWSKALVLGTSHFGGVGSSPTPVFLLTFL